MAIFNPDNPNVVVDTRLLVAWREGGFTIDSISGSGTTTLTVTDDLNPNDLVLTYTGSIMTATGNTPLTGTFTSISVFGGGTLSGIAPSNFAEIDDLNAYRIFDGSDTINGSTAGGDFLFAGYGGNDTLDGQGGGDFFRVSGRDVFPTLTIKGAVGFFDTLFVENNVFTGAATLFLGQSALTSIDAITLNPGTKVSILSSQLGAGLSTTAVIGATSGTGAFEIVKNTNGGTLDVLGLSINPNTTFHIFGTATGETISGSNGPENFRAFGGGDTLNGRGGADTFSLEEGSEFDTVNGGAGIDKVLALGLDDDGLVLNGFNAAASSIELWQGFVQGNAAANVFDFRGLKDQTAASAYFEVRGGAGNDTIFSPGFGIGVLGEEGDDVLIGGKASDLLAGEAGRDTLTGNGGSDFFYYFDVKDSVKKKALRDTINDFTAKSDKIELSRIDANGKKTGDQAFKFVKKEGAAFKKKPGTVIWDQIDKKGTAKDMTVVYADTNGDQKADLVTQLKGLVDLSKGDFVL